MDPELKKALDALNMSFTDAASAQTKALKDYQEANDANVKKHDALYDEKLDKLNAELDKFEPLSKALADIEARRKTDEEANAERAEQLDRIEARLNRPGTGSAAEDVAAKEYRDCFMAFARHGNAAFTDDRKNVLQTGDSTAAGYLAPPELIAEIIKEIVEFSPMRNYVRVRTTSNRAIQVPHRTGRPAAVWVGETETRPDTEGLSYGMDDIPVWEATMAVPISLQMLEDNEFNLDTEIAEAVSEGYGQQEGQALISGNAVKKPQGFLNAAGIGNVASGVTNDVTADNLIDLHYSIKTGYAAQGLFVLNRLSLAKVRKLKDGNGQYLWASGLAAGRDNTIDGAPYVEMPDMPNIGSGLKPIAFGDWKRGYTLVDRLAMTVLRDDVTRAGNGQVLFRWRRRLGGAVSIAEAISALTVN